MMTSAKRFLAATALAVTLVHTPAFDLTPAAIAAAEDASFDHAHFQKHDPAQAFEVNHAPMSNILKFITVTERGKSSAAYQALEGQALQYLEQYKGYLQSIKVSLLNRDEQLAYWLNLHNLGVIEKLAKDFRQKGKIKRLRGTPGDPGKWWSEKTFVVEGYELSLEDIEQRILIEGFKEPLILYGLCYGVKGSSLIGTEAFTGATVRVRLQELARNFINDRSNVRASSKRVRINSLYVWNKDVLFGGSDEAMLEHISAFANDNLRGDLASLDVSSIKIQDRFNWRTDAFTPRPQGGGGGGNGGGFGGGGGGGYGS